MDYCVDDVIHSVAASVESAEERFKKEKAEGVYKQQIIASLPTKLVAQLKQVHAEGLRADGCLHFQYQDLNQIEKLLDQLPPVPTLLVRGRTSSFFPKERYKPSPDVKSVSETFGVDIGIWGGSGGTSHSTVSWWTRCGPYLLRVSADECSRLDLEKVVGTKASPQSKKMTEWTFKKVPVGRLLVWGSFDPTWPGDITVYWNSLEEFKAGLHCTRDVTRKAT